MLIGCRAAPHSPAGLAFAEQLGGGRGLHFVGGPDCSTQPQTACAACRIDMNEVSNFCTGQVCSITASTSLAGAPGDLTRLQQGSCSISAMRLFRRSLHAACLPWQQACWAGCCLALAAGLASNINVSIHTRLSLAIAAGLKGACPALTAQLAANCLLQNSTSEMGSAQHIASAVILSNT